MFLQSVARCMHSAEFNEHVRPVRYLFRFEYIASAGEEVSVFKPHALDLQ
jgi:hypothetical protein